MSNTIAASKREPEVARLLFRRLQQLHEREEERWEGKIEFLYHLLSRLLVEVTGAEKLQFATLFARIAYASHRYELSRSTQFYLHSFRKRARQPQASPEEQALTYQLGLVSLAESIAVFYQQDIPAQLAQYLPPAGFYRVSTTPIVRYHARVRAILLADFPQRHQLLAKVEDQATEEVYIQYNIVDRNEDFGPTIQAIRQHFEFPLTVHLLQVEIDDRGLYRPRALVIEPDYLVDVSAISECFKDFGTEPLLYLLKKYLPFKNSAPLMLGNIANFFLDELLHAPETTYPQLARRLFQLNPIAFATFDDRELRNILQKAQLHYTNIKRMVLQGFSEHNIRSEHCFLEPTFYSNTYGVQGRLDVLCRNLQQEDESTIVELKSGRAFRPNIYGISANHFTQTLLYDLLIASTVGQAVKRRQQKDLRIINYILYSGESERQLRLAPPTMAQRYEALQTRNQLIALERQLSQLGRGEIDRAPLFDRIQPERFPRIKGFVQRDLTHFAKTYRGMSPLERKYFIAFSGFIAREQQLAKTGLHGNERRNGQAALWLSEEAEKQDNYDLLRGLRIERNYSDHERPGIAFSRTTATNPLANFRKGDIAVLYPQQAAATSPLQNQLFKCTITAIDGERVEIQLRSRQVNQSLFERYEHWNLEHDLLDSGFTGMYRNLFRFAQFEPRKKALFLGTLPPAQADQSPRIPPPPQLTAEQGAIFQKVLASEDYFLLWGPPGTGKTSMMLHHLVRHLLQHTDEQLLLLAYTNRAVDEICASIESIGDLAIDIRQQYLRIGSRHATQARFREQLLQEQIERISTRKDLKALIRERRIVVATVSSIASKTELLHLKHFDRVIIDEASQILEPMLLGLLPSFKRCLLIGDHKQLPAVVVQHPELSRVDDPDLRAIGLDNLRNSLFERLYLRCKAQGWDWAYAQLSQQGRMHRDIMDFPNLHFYEGDLQILPTAFDREERQTRSLHWPAADLPPGLSAQLRAQRLLFFPTEADGRSNTLKTNAHEAQTIVAIVEEFRALYRQQGRVLEAKSIGIITPYRAQIAQIRQSLAEAAIDSSELTIDTVERYQGGARDIIILSLCTNQLSQLSALVSESGEGVDRRLNVALTRAKEQLIVLGNPDILLANGVYRALMRAGGWRPDSEV
ncbi:MAG: DEAD/DEAH box helicase family protein [Bacteroidota bacterium]